MGKWDACVAAAVTSAGAVVVTTSPALFYGISASGSAVATVINVHDGVTTAGAKVFIVDAPAAVANHEGPFVPIVCNGGITTTNVGTVAAYIALYAKLKV